MLMAGVVGPLPTRYVPAEHWFFMGGTGARHPSPRVGPDVCDDGGVPGKRDGSRTRQRAAQTFRLPPSATRMCVARSPPCVAQCWVATLNAA